MEVIDTYFQLLFGAVIPTTTIAVSNIGIAFTVRRASQNRAKMSASHSKEGDKKENQLTAMLAVVSVVYLVTTTPHKLYITLSQLSAWNLLEKLNINTQFLTIYLVYDLWMCNYAVNFYLYCLAGGKGYRKDARTILMCRRPRETQCGR